MENDLIYICYQMKQLSKKNKYKQFWPWMIDSEITGLHLVFEL